MKTILKKLKKVGVPLFVLGVLISLAFTLVGGKNIFEAFGMVFSIGIMLVLSVLFLLWLPLFIILTFVDSLHSLRSGRMTLTHFLLRYLVGIFFCYFVLTTFMHDGYTQQLSALTVVIILVILTWLTKPRLSKEEYKVLKRKALENGDDPILVYETQNSTEAKIGEQEILPRMCR